MGNTIDSFLLKGYDESTYINVIQNLQKELNKLYNKNQLLLEEKNRLTEYIIVLEEKLKDKSIYDFELIK